MIKRKQKYRIFFVVVAFLGFGSALLAADRYSVRSGLWKNTSTWSATSGGSGGASTPVAGDVVFIESNHTIRVNESAGCSSITFTGNGAELNILANRLLSVSGAVTLNKQSDSNSGCSVVGRGSLYCLIVEVGSGANTPGGWWGTYSHAISSSVANWTISGNLNINSYWYFLFNIRNGEFYHESGAITIGGQITGTNGIGTTCTFSMATGSGDGTLILLGADPFDLDLGNDVLDLNGAASLVDYARSGPQIVINTDYNSITFSGSGTKTYASSTTVYGTMSMEGTATTGVTAPAYGIDATLQYKGTAAQNTGIEFPSTFSGTGGVIIDNANGVTLDSDRSIDLLLTFVNGVVNTGANTLTLASGGTVSGAGSASYVLGRFEKGIAAATATKTFEIGDASGYTPVVLDFTGTSNGTGSILAYTTNGDHPELASSNFSSSKTVNRYWTLSNNGVSGFTDFDATFTFLAGDADTGTDPNIFVVGSYNPSTWIYPTVGTRSPVSTQASGLSTFGDFQIGQFGSAFRSVASGNWEQILSWETYSGGAWIPAVSFPNSSIDAITIRSTHTIITTTSFSVDEFAILAGASLILGANMTVANGPGTDFLVNGTLDCGGSYTLSGAGSFILNDGATILAGSPDGISAASASGNIQTSSRSYGVGANYTYNGSAAQLTGDGLPSTVNNLSIDNSSGLSLTASVTINGALTLTDGALITGTTTLGFQNSDTPIVRTTGTITCDASTDIFFGSLGNAGGAAFVIPDETFTSAPTITNLTIERDNSLTLNDQNLSIYGILLCNGPLITAGNLTLLSDASGTALIDGSGTGSVSDSVTMQRYLPVAFGYKYFSSPFQAATVSEFADYTDLGSWFPTVYRYDESRTSSGWVAHNDSGDVLEPMNGYSINFGSVSAPNTVDVRGEVNNGPLSLTLYNNNNTYSQGMNLVGNPYPSAIDWDAATGWTKTNIDNALYYFNASAVDYYSGTYSSYVNGISSDGVASNVIPSMQGFLVHVSDGAYPVTGTLGMNNSVRITDKTQYFAKSTSSSKSTDVPLLRLSIMFTDDPLSLDPFVLYMDDLATSGFDSDLDARKLLNTDFSVPNLYALLPGGEKTSIDAIGPYFGDPLEIPLGVKANKQGKLVFDLLDLEAGFRDFELYFFDALTDARLKLTEDFEYEVFLEAGEHHDRFFLELQDLTVSTVDTKVHEEAFTAFAFEGYIKTRIFSISGNRGILSLYSIDGQLVFKQEITAPGDYEFEAPRNQGIYIVNYISGIQGSSVKLYIGN